MIMIDTSQATYPEFLLEPPSPSNGQASVFIINVDIDEPLPLHITDPENTTTTTRANELLRYLPPLHMSVRLPSTYPLEHSPVIQKLEAAYEWIPSSVVPTLVQMLMDMWDQGQTVLGIWIDFLRSGKELLSSLGLIRSNPLSIW